MNELLNQNDLEIIYKLIKRLEQLFAWTLPTALSVLCLCW